MSDARQSENLVRVGTVRRICTDVSGDRCRRSVVRVSLTMSAIRPLAPKLGHPVSLINRSRATACSGNAMCATCHVYVDNGWLDQLRAMAGDEDALLDGAAAERRPESRLS